MRERIANPANVELTSNGRLLLSLEQRKPEDMHQAETAAIVSTLRDLADSLEEDHLDAAADDVLDGVDHQFNFDDHSPSNVQDDDSEE